MAATLQSAFSDACVEGWEPLDGTFGLPDIDDGHVLAAAVVGGGGAIVTSNVKDFPRNLVPLRIEILTPAEFALHQVEQSPPQALRAVRAMAERNNREPNTVEAVLDALDARYLSAASVMPAFDKPLATASALEANGEHRSMGSAGKTRLATDATTALGAHRVRATQYPLQTRVIRRPWWAPLSTEQTAFAQLNPCFKAPDRC